MKLQIKPYLLTAGLFILISCSSSKEKVFEKEAAEQNRLLPAMIDAYTQIDSIQYVTEKNIFRYYYTLSGDADDANIASQKREELLQRLPGLIKNEPAMSIHRRHHVGMEYIYFSKSSRDELFRVKITPDMYE